MFALVLAPLLALAPPPPAHDCGAPQTALTSQNTPMRARKLGDLPDAEMDLAVIRSIDGCWVRQVVRFHVSDPRGGVPPEGAHVPGYTGTLVPDGPVAKPVQTAR
jgi:hypothetical protein